MSDQKRFMSMADCYHHCAPYTVPGYKFMQQAALDFIRDSGIDEPLLVDLGAGSGRFMARFLSEFPGSRAVWVDSSPDFKRVAQGLLTVFGDRVQFISSDFDEDWESGLPTSPDIIFSMSAIHHLFSENKQRLFKRIFGSLRPGGLFLLMDEMRDADQDQYLANMRFWVRYVKAASDRIPPGLGVYYKDFASAHQGWEKRNLLQDKRTKEKGDDIHELVDVQLAWMKEAGFEDCRSFLRYYLWQIISGRKPGLASSRVRA